MIRQIVNLMNANRGALLIINYTAPFLEFEFILLLAHFLEGYC